MPLRLARTPDRNQCSLHYPAFASVLGLLMLVLAGCGGHSDGLVGESNGYTYESVAEQIRAEDAANEAANKELDL